jgi:7-carboxy-7-deazaguanine synthase
MTGNDTLTVNEIFYSIQGEAGHAGLPCAFVRLTACDLRCRWCDTEYAFHEGSPMAVGEIVARVREVGCPLVEVTGGEPLLQPQAPVLVQALLDDGFQVLVETGGHLDVSVLDRRARIVMDLKCPGSGEADRNRWENLQHLGSDDMLKFVLAHREDYRWACDVLREHELVKRCPVFFSPVHGELDPAELAGWMLEDGVGARLQVQLHKVLWGADRRGV